MTCAQLLWLPPKEWAPRSPGSYSQWGYNGAIQESHGIIKNKEILNRFRTTLSPMVIHPGPSREATDKNAYFPVSP